MGWYSNVGGGFDGRSTGWGGLHGRCIILGCGVVGNVRSNGRVFRCVSLGCQGCGSVSGLPSSHASLRSTFLRSCPLDDGPPDSKTLTDKFGASREEVGASAEEVRYVSSICV
jgi:hypothetical protein